MLCVWPCGWASLFHCMLGRLQRSCWHFCLSQKSSAFWMGWSSSLLRKIPSPTHKNCAENCDPFEPGVMPLLLKRPTVGRWALLHPFTITPVSWQLESVSLLQLRASQKRGFLKLPNQFCKPVTSCRDVWEHPKS